MSVTLATGCFRDSGNYDYKDINEAEIGDTGFSGKYDIRINEQLVIHPEIRFTLDPDYTGDYSYEWVAVSQNMNRGERFTIGKERDLDYTVKLDADNYILYLKITDNSTGLVFSKDVELDVRSAYSVGWLLGGETPDGKGQVDMISISSDILFYKNTLQMENGLTLDSPVSQVWADSDQWSTEDRLYVSTADGTWKFDRETFKGNPYTHIKYSFALDPGEGSYSMSDSQQIITELSGSIRHIIIIDGKAYSVSSDNGMIGNTFSTYDNVSTFTVGDKMICNRKQSADRTFVFYDKESKGFCYISGVGLKAMMKLQDGEADNYSWTTTNDFPGTGLEFVTAVNSMFSNGQSIAIMRNPSTSKYYIYCITANSGYPSVSKDGRYEVGSAAVGFASASGYVLSTNHGYLLYASGNTLYGLNFRKGANEQICTPLMTFDAPVTCMTADHFTEEKMNDVFYAATYDDNKDRSGIVYKLQLEDSPDKVAAEVLDKWDEGFLKIRSMFYKNY